MESPRKTAIAVAASLIAAGAAFPQGNAGAAPGTIAPSALAFALADAEGIPAEARFSAALEIERSLRFGENPQRLRAELRRRARLEANLGPGPGAAVSRALRSRERPDPARARSASERGAGFARKASSGKSSGSGGTAGPGGRQGEGGERGPGGG